jgi:threonine/homoserine/homoserine lactone efflux protein
LFGAGPSRQVVGAGYSIYLENKSWQAPGGLSEPAGRDAITRSRRVFARTDAVTAFTPTLIIFFVAFVPQFLCRR